MATVERRTARRLPLVAGVALVSLLAAVQVVRSAAVADRERRPALAEALWPGHPGVATDRLRLAVTLAGTRGQRPPSSSAADIARIARAAPLAADPFLIAGAIAQAAGQPDRAERLLLAARSRDPRSTGTRYLLAERYLGSGRVAAGLTEMHVLVNLYASGATMGPALAAFARSPGAASALREFFATHPETEAGVLSALATDPANAGLVVSLASNRRDPEPDWRVPLLAGLAGAGDYERAFALSQAFSNHRLRRGLNDAGFAARQSVSPFDWSYPAGSGGVAEPDGRGGLKILYYGREPVVFARQLMLLAPGRYALALRSTGAGAAAEPLRLTIRCVSGAPVTELAVARGPVRTQVAVPSGCPAQWLEIAGRPGEAGASSERVLTGLSLAPEATR